MSLLLIITLLLALLGCFAGERVARYAAKRSTAQPVSVELAAEKKILGTILANPQLYPAVAELHNEMFVLPAHQRIWAALEDVMLATGEKLAAADEAELRILAEKVPADTVTKVLQSLSAEDTSLAENLTEKATDLRALQGVLAGPAPVGEPRKGVSRAVIGNMPPQVSKESKKALTGLLRAGSLIMAAAEDRTSFQGRAPIVTVDDNEKPLKRKYVPAGRSRIIFTSLLTGVGMGLIPFLILERTPIESGIAQIVAGVAVAIMLLVSVLVALVDWDTLYLDLPPFWWGMLIVTILTVTAQILDGEPGRLIHGVLAIVVMLIVVEGILKLYAKLRGIPMQGGGDTQILFMTAGIPAALSASMTLGLFGGIIASAAVALLVNGVMTLRGKFNKETPFAFGPYLALGWILGWVVGPLIIPGVYL